MNNHQIIKYNQSVDMSEVRDNSWLRGETNKLFEVQKRESSVEEPNSRDGRWSNHEHQLLINEILEQCKLNWKRVIYFLNF